MIRVLLAVAIDDFGVGPLKVLEEKQVKIWEE